MFINKYVLLILSSFFIISCNTNAQKDKAYEVLNAVFDQLDTNLKERIEKNPESKYLKEKLNNSVYVNPVFSHLLTSKFPKAIWKNNKHYTHDFWILNFMLNFNSIKEFDYKELRLIKDSIYYINEIKKSPDTLDLSRIQSKRFHYYKTEFEKEKHIKQYESWKRQGVDSITLKNRKRLMLGYENKHFQISYPIFSKNEKYAIVYIENERLGMQLWILQKENEKWKKACAVHIGTIN